MVDAPTVLQKLIKTIAKELRYFDHDIEFKAFSSDGANYTSKLYSAVLSGIGKNDVHLFAKVATVSEKLRNSINADWLYGTEKYVYTELVPLFKELQDTNAVPEKHRINFPKFYGCTADVGQETIVMENLVAKGWSSFDRFKSLTCEHVASCMEELANLHALSFAFEKEYPEKYKKTLEYLAFRQIEVDENNQRIFEEMIKNAMSVLNDNQRRCFGYFIQNAGDKFFSYNKPFKTPVLIHGDYRPSNQLYKRKNGKIQLMTVDYQTLHTGCLANDIVYFFTLATDTGFRKLHFNQMIDHYYRHLSDTLKCFKVDIDEMYPRDVFDLEIKEMLPYAVITGLIVLPLICVDANSAPNTSGEAEMNTFVVQPNELYAERFRGIIDDCIAWGAL